MKGRITAKLMVSFFSIFLLFSFISPFIPKTSAAVIGLTNNQLSAYEIMNQWQKEISGGSVGTQETMSCLVGMFDRGDGGRSGFAKKIRQGDYDNGAFYGYFQGNLKQASDINVSISADRASGGDGKNGKIRCETAEKFIVMTIFGDRKKALDAMYDTSKLKLGEEAPSRYSSVSDFLNSEMNKWLANIQSNPDWKDSYNIYRDKQIVDAFGFCYTLKSGRDAGYDKYESDNYDTNHENTNTGWAAEIKVEGSYSNGNSSCDDVKTYVFDNKLFDATGESEQNIRERNIRAEIISNSNYKSLLAACVGSTGSDLTSQPVDKILDSITSWLASGGDGPIKYTVRSGATTTTEKTISVENSKKIKDCLLAEGAFGDDLAKVVSADINAAPDNSKTDEDKGVLGDCEFVGGWNITKWVPGALDWFGCVVAKAMISILETLTKAIGEMLQTNVNDRQEDSLKAIWSNFLTFANIIFVIAFLVMVLSTALDLGIFDAYTVKKLLPRIIVAVILANLSFFIARFCIDITNLIGSSAKEIILSPVSKFNPPDMNLGADFGTVLAGLIGSLVAALVVAVSTGSVFVMVPALIAAVFGIVVGFMTILARRIIIILLIVIAPLALALWVLPGTEGWAKRWWKTFIQMLLVYPIIMALLATGQLTCALIINGRAANDLSFFEAISAFAVLLIPYFVLPTVFKMASSTLGNVTGMINDKSKGLVDRGKNWGREKASQTDNALSKKAMKDDKLRLRNDRQRGVALDRLANRGGIRGWNSRRGLGEQDQQVLKAELSEHAVRRQSAEAKASNAVRAGYQLDAASDVEDFKTRYLADNSGATTKEAQDHAMDWIANRARSAAESGTTEGQEKFNALTSYLAQQKAEKQLNTLQSEAAVSGNDKLTKAWTGAVGNQTTYGDLKGYGAHYVAAVKGGMSDGELNNARADAINSASLGDRATMPASAWTFYESAPDLTKGGSAKSAALEGQILANDAASAAYKGQRSSKPTYIDAHDSMRRNVYDSSRSYDKNEVIDNSRPLTS